MVALVKQNGGYKFLYKARTRARKSKRKQFKRLQDKLKHKQEQIYKGGADTDAAADPDATGLEPEGESEEESDEEPEEEPVLTVPASPNGKTELDEKAVAAEDDVQEIEENEGGASGNGDTMVSDIFSNYINGKHILVRAVNNIPAASKTSNEIDKGTFGIVKNKGLRPKSIKVIFAGHNRDVVIKQQQIKDGILEILATSDNPIDLSKLVDDVNSSTIGSQMGTAVSDMISGNSSADETGIVAKLDEMEGTSKTRHDEVIDLLSKANVASEGSGSQSGGPAGKLRTSSAPDTTPTAAGTAEIETDSAVAQPSAEDSPPATEDVEPEASVVAQPLTEGAPKVATAPPVADSAEAPKSPKSPKPPAPPPSAAGAAAEENDSAVPPAAAPPAEPPTAPPAAAAEPPAEGSAAAAAAAEAAPAPTPSTISSAPASGGFLDQAFVGGAIQSKKQIYNLFRTPHKIKDNGELEVINKHTHKMKALKPMIFFKTSKKNIQVGFIMVELLKCEVNTDLSEYLLIKPLTLNIDNVDPPIKACNKKCTINNTKKLQRYIRDIFNKNKFKTIFDHPNKNLLIMYILDNKNNVNLELVILNSNTNTLTTFDEYMKCETSSASSPSSSLLKDTIIQKWFGK